MRDESWDARRSWERERYESTLRGEGSSGWYDVAESGPDRRVSEGEVEGRRSGSSAWTSERPREMNRYASFPGSGSSSSYYNTSTPRQTAYPSFRNDPFTPVARPPPPHERISSSQRPRSPMQLFSQSRSTSPPSLTHLPPTSGSRQQPSHPHQHPPPLEDKPIIPLSSTNISPLSSATALPSFRDFLYTTSTTSSLLPSSLPPSTAPVATQFAPHRSSYASSNSSSSNSHQTHPRRPSSSSSRGIGGASEAGGGGRAGRSGHTSSSTSSHPRSPTASSYGGGNRGLPLPPPSTFAFPSSSSSNQGLVSSSLGNESFGRPTLPSPLFPPPTYGVEPVPFLARRARPSSISGSSSMSSSAPSSSSQRNPPTPSVFVPFPGVGGPPTFAALPSSRGGSISDHSSNNSATEKQVSPALSAGTVGIGLESMEIEEEGRRGGVEGGGGESEGGLGVRALPGMLDVVGFGGNVGLGKFSVSGGSSMGSR